MAKGVLVDITRCIGCRSCQIACKQWHELPAQQSKMTGEYNNPQSMSADCYTVIRFLEKGDSPLPTWHFTKDQCMHCKAPACVSACPVGALQKTSDGPVIYDQFKCIGCRYCMLACPFNIPKYEWDTTNPWIQKCDFCADRIQQGLEPACVKACPMNVMYFDEYDKVVAEAKSRLKKYPAKYVNHIYGLKEAGGTSWIYISDRPFKELGFKDQIPAVPYPSLTWKPSLSKIFWEEAGLLAILAGIALFRNRGKKEEAQK